MNQSNCSECGAETKGPTLCFVCSNRKYTIAELCKLGFDRLKGSIISQITNSQNTLSYIERHKQ